jgi:hypothetical protein
MRSAGPRGSLKWIRHAITDDPDSISRQIIPELNGARHIEWRSPLKNEHFREYRDAAFLERIEAGDLTDKLSEFWPARGPCWDALGYSNAQDALLVEAKAHIAELFSTPSRARPASQVLIESSLNKTQAYLGARPRVPWTGVFYQLANRLAHLHFLREHGKKAWLVLVNIVGDSEMNGPGCRSEWEAAYKVAWHVLGLRENHPLSRYVIHAYLPIGETPTP